VYGPTGARAQGRSKKAGRPLLRAAGPCGVAMHPCRPALESQAPHPAGLTDQRAPASGSTASEMGMATHPSTPTESWPIIAGRPWPGWVLPEAEASFVVFPMAGASRPGHRELGVLEVVEMSDYPTSAAAGTQGDEQGHLLSGRVRIL